MSPVVKKALVVLLGLSFVILLPFLPDRQPPPDTPLKRTPIADLIARGNYEDAYRQLAELDPVPAGSAHDLQRELQRAICERFTGRPENAFERLQRLPNAQPLFLEEYRRFWMGELLEEMKDRDAAIAAYQDFLRATRHPILQHRARLRLARLHAARAAYDQALDLYQQMLASAPEHRSEALFSLGQLHQRRGERDAAHQYWLQLAGNHPESTRALEALALFPEGSDVQELYLRAQIYIQHRRLRQAADQLARLRRAHPHHELTHEAWYSLGQAYATQRQFDQARKIFDELFAQRQHPGALFSLADIEVRRNRQTAAIATYQRFVELFPHHQLADKALWQAARAAERTNRFALAARLYGQLVDDYPQSAHHQEANWNIGFMFYCQEEYQQALELFARLGQTASQPHIIDQSLFWAGKAAESLGQSETAHSYFLRAAQEFPRSYYSARAVSLGYPKGMPLTPRPTLSLNPPSVAVHLQAAEDIRRADALYQLGLNDLARQELQHAERLNLQDLETLRTIRDRYERLGLPDQAMRLSAQIFVADPNPQEIPRIYPNYYWDKIVEAAQDAQVDPYLVLSVMRQESSFRVDAVSRAGALGLMQIMPKTGESLARTLGMEQFSRPALFDPEVSIRMGSRFLGDQVRRFAAGPAPNLNLELGLAAYNAGPHNANRWLARLPHHDPDAFIERIPYQETRLYIKLVLRNYTIYKVLSNV